MIPLLESAATIILVCILGVVGVADFGVEEYSGTPVVNIDSISGRFSTYFGGFIFVNDVPANEYGETLKHEYGHSVQARAMGPLYLPIIGVLSLSSVAVADVKSDGWIHWNAPWEVQANKLGGAYGYDVSD